MTYAKNRDLRSTNRREVYSREGLATIARQYVLENGLGCLADLETPAFIRRLWSKGGGMIRGANRNH